MSGSINIHAGVINGGIATAPGGQATGAGGSIYGSDPHALQSLLDAVRAQSEALAPSQRQVILSTAQDIETAAASDGPRSAKVRQLLATMRTVTEGTVASLIATYMGGL